MMTGQKVLKGASIAVLVFLFGVMILAAVSVFNRAYATTLESMLDPAGTPIVFAKKGEGCLSLCRRVGSPVTPDWCVWRAEQDGQRIYWGRPNLAKPAIIMAPMLHAGSSSATKGVGGECVITP